MTNVTPTITCISCGKRKYVWACIYIYIYVCVCVCVCMCVCVCVCVCVHIYQARLILDSLYTSIHLYICSIGPKYVVSERKEFAEKKNSKLEF